MLKPQITSVELGPDLRGRIEPPIFDALFDHVRRHPPTKRVRGVPSLTVSDAKDVLKIVLPHYRDQVAASLGQSVQGLVSFKEMGVLVHQWIHESVRFFRREGAAALREALRESDEERRSVRLWGVLFSRCLLRLIQSSGLLDDPQKLESCDLAVECLRLWVRDLSRKLGKVPSEDFSPALFFLDTEGDLTGVIEWKGSKLHLRGKPDALVLNPKTGHPEVYEYKFGLQGQLELQIAQVLFYLRLVNVAKEQAFDTGRLEIFRLVPDTEGQKPKSQSEFPAKVDAAFDGYIGNYAAVRRLKVECALALRQGAPPRMPVNLMFCGPGGLGKTELARRVAKALELPFVDIPGGSVNDVEVLLQRVDATLKNSGLEPVEAGTDSGLPLLKYPPLVIFIDEVHELRRRADTFLNMFEPKEKRAVARRIVGDFKDATILAATTDKGLLPGPFLTRFRIVDLVPYSAEEVGAIIKPVFQEKGKCVDDDFLIALAKRGRLNPRIAKERAKEMLNFYLFNENAYPLNLEGLKRMSSENWQENENGLTNNDLTFLKALKSGPKGLNALAALLPVGRDEIANVIEPYLLNLEAIRLTERGRELTEQGRLLVGG